MLLLSYGPKAQCWQTVARFGDAFRSLILMFCDNLAIYISIISYVINIIKAPQC